VMPHQVKITFQGPTQGGQLKTHTVTVADSAEAHALIAAVTKYGYYYVQPGDPPGAHTIIPINRLVELKEIIT